MRVLLLKLSAIVLPVGAIVVFSNYFIDPANLFSSGSYVSGIASIMVSGHNVDGVSNYDERLLQEQVIKRIPATPEVVVLGSSRAMEIGTGFFTGKKVLNAGVSHANIKDIVAIAGLLDSAGKMPGEIMLNVDARLVGEQGTQEWESLAPYYYHFFRTQKKEIPFEQHGSGSNNMHKLYSLVSFEYFKSSVSFLLNGGSKKYCDCGTKTASTSGRFSDGTISYSQKYLHPDTVATANSARTTALKEGMQRPDSSKLALLNELLDYLQGRNVKVSFVMVPYHPEYYSTINKSWNNLLVYYDTMFRDMARKRNINVYGSYDGSLYGLSGKDFYDMYHCSKGGIQKIFNQ